MLAEFCLHHADSVEGQLELAYRRVVCRTPENGDLTRLRSAFDKQYAIYKADTQAAEQLLSVGASKRDDTLAPARCAALTAVCLGILNLDEALTRE